VQVLPWWDWRPLYQQRCLVSNPHFSPPPPFSKEDCVSCEAVEGVERVQDVTYQHLIDAYLQRNAPVIVVDAMDEWDALRPNFGIENITQVKQNHLLGILNLNKKSDLINFNLQLCGI
jgi:hypothetical protein